MVKELLALGTPPMMAMSVSLHEVRRKLDERAFYPKHDPRKESAAYRAVHKAMVVTEDQPCAICGVRQTTLKNKADNPFGATQMETHHAVIEWALLEAISLQRFVEKIVKPRAELNPEKYKRRFTVADMRAWIDHDRDNIVVLCDVNHRHKWFGVHSITGPIWSAQALLRPFKTSFGGHCSRKEDRHEQHRTG
jgi:hypothetical protein